MPPIKNLCVQPQNILLVHLVYVYMCVCVYLCVCMCTCACMHVCSGNCTQGLTHAAQLLHNGAQSSALLHLSDHWSFCSGLQVHLVTTFLWRRGSLTHTIRSSDGFCLDRECLTSVISWDKTSPLTTAVGGDHAYVCK